MRIEKAKKENAREVARIYVDGWKTTYQGLVPDDYLQNLSYHEAEQKWQHFLTNEDEPFIFLAINETEKIIGFAAGKNSNNETFEGELYALYLIKESRGLGTGRQLVSSIAKEFLEKDIDSMMVWVMEQNKSGLGFYERMGGETYIRRKNSIGGIVVDDIAYGWKDITSLINEDE